MNLEKLLKFQTIKQDGKTTFEIFLYPNQMEPQCFLCQAKITEEMPTIILTEKHQGAAVAIGGKVLLFCSQEHAALFGKTSAKTTKTPCFVSTLCPTPSPTEPDASEPSCTISSSSESIPTP
jgi:hypothetical protein